ncbi:MAG: PD40 domain-containing protein [Verrucomicrobia bacterium]|nr:PD40 domain-containing protein [Verrucomicrobiota bacterium]
MKRTRIFLRGRAVVSVVSALALAVSAWAADEAKLYREFLQDQTPDKARALVELGAGGVPFVNRALEQGGRPAALCAWALAQHPLPDCAKALHPLLHQVDQVAGYWAAKALGRMPSPENVRALAALLPDERLAFWELSAGGVGRLTDIFSRGQRQSAPAQDWMPNLRVACAAMESLGELGGEEPAKTLLRALDNDQYLIRYGAARGLGRMRQKGRTGVAPVSIFNRLALAAESDAVLVVRLAARQAMTVTQGDAEGRNILTASPVWVPRGRDNGDRRDACPTVPAIAFIKTKHRSAANLGFRDSYFFPLTPKYHSGENLYTLTPPQPDGALKNLTQLQNGEVQGPEVSFDGAKLLFAMRRDKTQDGFHIFEINTDGGGLRQITDGNCNDVDPAYLPDGRIVFCSDRAGYQEYYHQERSRVIYVMNADGSGLEQITFNPNQDYEPLTLSDGRVLYGSYRFYAQDGSEGPLAGEFMGLARIETVLRVANPDGSADNLFYGSMRGSFYSPMRPMPFSDQFAGWHKRGYHVGVSISQARELPDGRLVCVSPAGLTMVDAARVPVDCEAPIYPEVVNLAGGERVYIHPYDEMNPVGRYTTPSPAGGDWILVSHAPWHDLRANGYALYLLNLATREMQLVYDDPQMAEVDPVALVPRVKPAVRVSALAAQRDTGLIYCNSVFNSDLPYDRKAAKFVRVLEAVQMGQSIAANAAFRTRLLGAAPIREDGSFYVEVPADVPVRFELVDDDGKMLVHETEFNSVRPGETKGCVGCHESRQQASANSRPLALDAPPVKALRQRGDLIYMGKPSRPYNALYRE